MTENTVQLPNPIESEYNQLQRIQNVNSPKRTAFVIGITVIFLLIVLFILEFSGLYSITYTFKSLTSHIFQRTYQNEIIQLNSILSSINTIPQPIDPSTTSEEFKINKEQVKININNIKEALKINDTETALKVLGELRAGIREFGDPMKGKFIPKEIRDDIDPSGTILKPTDRVDPNPIVMDPFLTTFKFELALRNK